MGNGTVSRSAPAHILDSTAGVLLALDHRPSLEAREPSNKKEGPPSSPLFYRILFGLLDQSHVLGLQSLWSLLDFELHLRAFVQ